jgi:hypothetical protein
MKYDMRRVNNMNRGRKNMKRMLVMIMLVFPMFASAQKEYDSLLSESRLWTMDMKLYLDPKECNIYRNIEMKLAGDTIINGIHFMQRFEREWPRGEAESETWITTHQYVGQDGSKVYLYSDFDWEKEIILDMDFSLEVGDKIDIYDGDPPPYAYHFVVTSVSDTILDCSTDRIPRRCLHVQVEEFPDETDVWIEGIGSLTYGIWGTGMIFATGGGATKLTKCTDGDSVLFEGKGFETAIHTVKSPDQSTIGTLYDLSGRRVQGTLKKGVYIRDGKKVMIK